MNYQDKLDELFCDNLGYDFIGQTIAKPQIEDKENILSIEIGYEAPDKNIQVIVVECEDRVNIFQKELIRHYKRDGKYTDAHFLFVSHQGKVFDLYNVSTSKKLKPITYNEANRKTKLFEEKIQLFNVETAEDSIDLKIQIEQAFDIQEKITKAFYEKFRKIHQKLTESITGIHLENDRRWYASVLLNRLMFIFFLQKHGAIQDNTNFMLDKFDQIEENEEDFFHDFLLPLFFLGFAKQNNDPDKQEFTQRFGEIIYLNGGLFQPHELELKYDYDQHKIQADDTVLHEILKFLNGYNWYLDNRPNEDESGISPHILGFIFEKYINQKAFGAYYTPPEITKYLCRQSIQKVIFDKVKAEFGSFFIEESPYISQEIKDLGKGTDYLDFDHLIRQLTPEVAEKLIFEMLPNLKLIDPSCGSGAFLIAMLDEMHQIYDRICHKIPQLDSPKLQKWIQDIEEKHSLSYYLKRQIITQNIYGVDIMQEAVEIAQLRLFLDLVSNVKPEQIEPLPNIDFNIVTGNSLIGLLRVDEHEFNTLGGGQMSLDFGKSYREYVNEKEQKIDTYKKTRYADNDILISLKKDIYNSQHEARKNLNQMLRDQFQKRKIWYKQATWDEAKSKLGKPTKRSLSTQDIEKLQPFHWGYEFSEVFRQKNGFDAIITNPPWEIVKPNAKEFFAPFSEKISAKKMTIKAFKKVEKKLMQNPEIKTLWLQHQSSFFYQSDWFRNAPQFKNQISVVNGRKQGTDINLYKLFTEQCYNLLNDKGFCGIVIPSGIYTDLGTKQLRKLLFEKTQITGLFCFENRRAIFEGVDSRFKFVVLGFEKGKQTTDFPAQFMRHDVAELEQFPNKKSVRIDRKLIQKLSPDSLSIPEFKNDLDFQISEKMIQFPLLGEKLDDKWNLKLGNEFHMTNDSHLFQTENKAGFLRLFEGKMIHQFRSDFAEPRYFIDENEGRKSVLGARNEDEGQVLDYQKYRLGFRDIARNTDARTFIATILPKHVFAGNTINLTKGNYENIHLVYLSGLLNSFLCDYQIRQKVTAHCNLFYTYQNFIPRLQKEDNYFSEIVGLSAVLVCYDSEGNLLEAYRDLWEDMGYELLGFNFEDLVSLSKSALRAKLDALVAKLYNLEIKELEYILSTFPLVEEGQKELVLQEFSA